MKDYLHQEFVKMVLQIMGGLTLGEYGAAFFFCGLGQIAAIRLHAFYRDRSSNRTPVKWSWRFFFKDNIVRFITGMALMFIMFRFFGEITGKTFGMFWAMLLGMGLSFGIDIVILRNLKNRTNIFNAKPKDEPENNNQNKPQ